MRVLVTRPLHESHAWVDALQAAGHAAEALPLIDIGPPADLSAVHAAWHRWSSFQAAMFVSAQAVRMFFQARPSDLPVQPNEPRCWATGLGTQRALLQAGVVPSRIDCPAADAPQFDSETLWALVRSRVRAQQPVLIVRGADGHHASAEGAGRDWLSQQLQAAHVPVAWVAAYVRSAPVWTSAQQAIARQAAQDGSVWCFSSSQALQHLAQCLPATDWSHARAIATHARIAQAAQALGFGQVQVARPLVSDVLASLESWA